MVELEEEVTKSLNRQFCGSTYAFFSTSTVNTNYQLNIELNYEIEEVKECIDKCFCSKCQECFPNTFKPMKKKEEERQALLDEDAEEPHNEDDVEHNQTTDEQKMEETKKTIVEEETKKTNVEEETKKKEIQEIKKKKPCRSHCCSKRDKKEDESSYTVVAVIDDKDMKPNHVAMSCNNVVDPDDILWYNIGAQVRRTCPETILYYLIMGAMFFFLSTPSAILQVIKRVKFMATIINGNWTAGMGPIIGPFVKEYLTTGVTLLCNKLFLMVATLVGRATRYPSKSDYHAYIFRISYAYYTINMVIMPGLS